MTRDDCMRMARLLVEAEFGVPAVATALAKAHDLGIERAAVDLESKFKVQIQGRKIALYGAANAVRALKIGDPLRPDQGVKDG